MPNIWLLTFLVLCLTPSVTFAQVPNGPFSEDLGLAQYNCAVMLTPAKSLSSSSTVLVQLEQDNAGNAVQVTIDKNTLSIATLHDGKAAISAERITSGVKPGAPYRLMIIRRGDSLRIEHDNRQIYHGNIPHAAGAQGEITADRGWTIDDIQVQRIEPVMFTDDFMRTEDEQLGEWTVQSGNWNLQSAWDAAPQGRLDRFSNIRYAQNPFAWVGRSSSKQTALCTTGSPYWEDYTASVSVMGSADGALGLYVNMTDAKNGFLARWSPMSGSQAVQDNALVLYKITEGKSVEIARSAGGYFPGQWYRLSVVSAPTGIRVLVDGRERLAVSDLMPWHGGIGLYATGREAIVFDDVAVYGRSLDTDLLLETEQTRIGQQFLDDSNGMKEWALLQSDWLQDITSPDFFWYRWKVYGDRQWMTAVVKPSYAMMGDLWLLLNTDGRTTNSGYRAIISNDDQGKMRYAIYREKTLLASQTGDALQPGETYTFRFWQTGSTLKLDLDGDTLLSATDQTPLNGLYAAYRANGMFTRATDIMILSHQVIDDTFVTAPVNWIGEGTWMPTVRWSCSPNWSFLSGWSRGDAALWSKYRFSGDHALQAFVGLKMEYPREREYYEERYRDFAITICGDGHDPRSGYTGIYGAPDINGVPNSRAILMRNGVVVAEREMRVAGKGGNHRNWFDLRLIKTGRNVQFWVEGSNILEYTDADPIDSGVPAVWTSDNGISLARVRLFFATPPQPRTDHLVVLDDPWYPEWGNLGQTMHLDFPRSWSSTGKPVQLQVDKQSVPQGMDALVGVKGTQVTFTPRTTGYHWYQITAHEGENRSPAFHLWLQVFDPSVRRDDSHAIVLYRFTEGKGETITDQSRIGKPINLVIGDGKHLPADMSWLPGQGLSMHGLTKIISNGNADKLQRIATAHAGSIEFWVSTDSIYPPSGWAATLLSWEDANSYPNFLVGHYFSSAPGNVIFTPRGEAFNGQSRNVLSCQGFRTGLQHIVYAWDGRMTRCYINGKLTVGGEKMIDWNIGQWQQKTRLVLGNQGDGSKGYRGTYYLLAIHDRCMSAADVAKHYAAGPSAR